MYNIINHTYLTETMNYICSLESLLNTTATFIQILILLFGTIIGGCAYYAFSKKQKEAVGNFYAQLYTYLSLLKLHISIDQNSEKNALPIMSNFLNYFNSTCEDDVVKEYRSFVNEFLHLFLSSDNQIPLIKPKYFKKKRNEYERIKWLKNKETLIKFLYLSTKMGREKVIWDINIEDKNQLEEMYNSTIKTINQILCDIEQITSKTYGFNISIDKS